MSAGDIRAPQPDADAILRTLTLLFNSDDVVELRALTTRGRKRIDAGYFDGEHRSDLTVR
ncbi:MAG: hypothetical protein M3Q32_06725 [Pseudomonadota bacterium]|nr:hypothetical protein [Burkholderiales bacterium]MDQ3196058.1 hypothetical protein [Pseudomonadota bacterium]